MNVEFLINIYDLSNLKIAVSFFEKRPPSNCLVMYEPIQI